MNLKEMFKKSGMKQNHLAKIMGVHQNQVSRWLRGEQSPQGKNYKRLVEILNGYNQSKWNKPAE
tara:strand:+ start:1167 stop:1358 length:192 start_codon:yes stop_codon:yes gene_type:complete